MTVIKRYLAKYESEDFALLSGADGKPLVELPFAIELYRHTTPDGKVIVVVYTGRIDLPIFAEGANWIMDTKTTSMIGSQHWDKQRMSSQQRGYCWSFEQLTGKRVAGYVVNTIRTKEPPLYVQRGEPSTRGKSTNPETWWNESIQRERFYIKPGELEEWRQNTIALIEGFFWHYHRGYLPMETALGCAAYGRCPYFDVCTLAPADRDLFLQSGLFTNNVWSPLQQPSQPKQ
jgi:hypothetical protein